MKAPEKVVRQDVWVAKTYTFIDQPIKEIEKLMRELERIADEDTVENDRYSICPICPIKVP